MATTNMSRIQTPASKHPTPSLPTTTAIAAAPAITPAIPPTPAALTTSLSAAEVAVAEHYSYRIPLPRRGTVQGTRTCEEIDAAFLAAREPPTRAPAFAATRREFEPRWLVRKLHWTMQRRQASHAGSWYPELTRACRAQIDSCLDFARLDSAKVPAHIVARALITPHGGFAHSGQTAAYAFKHMDVARTRRVFVLAPAHQARGRTRVDIVSNDCAFSFFTTKCCLSRARAVETPLGNIDVDTDVMAELALSGAFDWLAPDVDEDEHAIEMQLPFVCHMMEGREYTLVPILVGELSFKLESTYAKILAPYFADPQNFFIMSSDFCHWGARFGYTYSDPAAGAPWQWITRLDALAIRSIESADAQRFAAYYAEYKNTICGRHVIGMLLNLIKLVDPQLKISFNRYSQSHKCQTVHDASVSYGSAVVWSPNKQPALPATMTPTRASTAAASSFSRASTAAFSGGFGDDGNGGGSFKKLATSGYFAGDSCTFDFGAITGESDGGASSDPFGSGATKTLFGSGALSPAHAATPRHTHAPNTPRVAAFARRFDERAQARADRSERESDWAQLGDALNEAELAVANRQSTRGEEGLSPRVLLEMKFTVPARSNEPPLFAADPRPPVGALASSVAPVAPVPLKETPTRSNGSAKLQAPGTHAYVRREPPQHRVATTAAASDGSVSIAYRSLARSTWLRILEFLPLQFALHTFACLASDFARAVDLDLQLEREGLCLWRCSRPDAMDAAMQHVALRCAQSLRRIHLVACAALRDSHCDALFREFPRVDELALDACDWVTDDGLLPLLAATGAQLRSLRLAHWVGAVECTELPLQVLGDTLASASASASAVSASSSSSFSGCRLESLHLIDMPERMLPEAACARLLSQLPAQSLTDLRLERCAPFEKGHFSGAADSRLGRAGEAGAQLDPALCGACFVTDRELEAVAGLKRLTHLSLAGMGEHWRASALLKLIRALPALCSLDLSRCAQVNDALIASICRSVGPRLRALRVCHCANLTDASLAFLTRSYCPRLESLDLTGIVVGGREGAPMSEAAVAALRAATHATVRTHALPGVV